jgi:hypothetical protein
MSDSITSNDLVLPAGRFDDQALPAAKAELSLPRLYVLRAAYFFISVGMGSQVWPIVFSHTNELANIHGARFAMLAGLTAMTLLGLRYPLKMLPLLLFEVTWKLIYLAAFALPLWSAHDVSEATASNISAVVIGVVIVILMIPWRYVFAQYVTGRADRWK